MPFHWLGYCKHNVLLYFLCLNWKQTQPYHCTPILLGLPSVPLDLKRKVWSFWPVRQIVSISGKGLCLLVLLFYMHIKYSYVRYKVSTRHLLYDSPSDRDLWNKCGAVIITSLKVSSKGKQNYSDSENCFILYFAISSLCRYQSKFLAGTPLPDQSPKVISLST